MDLLVRGGTIVTCDAEGRVLEGDVLVRAGRIVALGAADALAAKGLSRPYRVLDATGCAVIPGFVQAHVHLCQVLMRGMADDLPLLSWLKERIWPLEAAHDEASLTASAELGLLEMMRAGTTTILDMGTVRHHDVVFDACARAGIRAFSGKTMMDIGEGVPDGLRESTKGSLRESERLAKTWNGAEGGRLRYAFAPRFILSCTEELVRGAVALAHEHDALLHSHASEHPDEVRAVLDVLGAPDVDVLRKWGFAGPRAILAHGVQLTEEQARAVAEDGTRFVHCPSANLKLGSGIAPVHQLDAAGVKLALGADGAPCNNNLDPWIEMRHAALLAKVRTGITALPASRVLRLATIDGARALGMENEIGSIEEGKRADLVVVRIDGAHAEPGGDAISRLVYACQSRDVVHVLVDGALVVRSGEHERLDGEEILTRARQESRELSCRAGLA